MGYSTGSSSRTSTPSYAALKKLYRRDNSALSLCYIRDDKIVDSLADFIIVNNVKSLYLNAPSNPNVFTKVLQQLAKVKNKFEILHFDLWSNSSAELVNLLSRALNAHSETLLELTLKCRFNSSFLATLFPKMPTNIEILDISENLLSDTLFLRPLIDYAKCSELRILKLANCCTRTRIVNDFAKALLKVTTPLALEYIEGVDFTNCEDIPRKVRTNLRDAPADTRKKYMGRPVIGMQPRRGCNVQLLDYIKSSLLMHRLVGSRVRVWWPASSDEHRGAFAGRYWPATVLRTNPIDMIIVVEYDNQEVDHVPCKLVQPESPFLFGGGLNENFLRSLFGSKYFDSLSEELKSLHSVYGNKKKPPPSAMRTPQRRASLIDSSSDSLSLSISLSSLEDIDQQLLELEANQDLSASAPVTTVYAPIHNEDTTLSDTSKLNGDEVVESSSDQDQAPDDAICSNTVEKRPASFEGNNGNVESPSSKILKTEEPTNDDDTSCIPSLNHSSASMPELGLDECESSSQQDCSPEVPKQTIVKDDVKDEKCTDITMKPVILNALMRACERRNYKYAFPGDVSHIANSCSLNVETINGIESQYSGNVLDPGDICEFRDPLDLDGSDPSDYIVVIKEVRTVEPMYRVIYIYHDDEECVDVYSSDVRRLTLLPWYHWVSLVMDIERHLLFFKGLCDPLLLHRTYAEFLVCPNKLDLNKPINCPINPLQMPMQTLYARSLDSSHLRTPHPRMSVTRDYEMDDGNTVEGLRYQLSKQQQKMNALRLLYEETRRELEKERDNNARLQAKLNCIICFENRINCVLNPCGHFNFCNLCAESCTNCPICRGKIKERKTLNVE
ncbi:Zinc finger C3HC4 type (RING finger) family protein [Babesia bovis T2Bo]|uniref:RING-type domain-containing protein n=1 Tax=Babesia bovis TaxID=5865 RepID=A7AMT1_BABBO|nr:Zinc finger C3HC4 type (RING finger) family protein [Babesia bovis T2Bo]EDO07865.1 Zinc finger C3HC4 type (RING finger) family protein [Babesia bovis T2Bo]|eukprot:XP_001611433.1 hypothetical protein [Babesia bovis T2Bo]